MIALIIVWLVTGLIVGALGRLLVPGPNPMGILATALVGLGGSLVGTLIGRLIFGPGYTAGIVLSVLGAALLVYAFQGRGGGRARRLGAWGRRI